MTYDRRELELCRYYYDPLDRQIGYALARQNTLRFYCNNRLATETSSDGQTSIFRHDDRPLAELRRRTVDHDTLLLATEQKGSVMGMTGSTVARHSVVYTPHGYHLPDTALLGLLRFNGERPDSLTGCYHLGLGYRQYNPLLMKFCSPDNLSAFGKGGLNAYAYCGGEPVLRADPDGHSFLSFFRKPILNIFTSRQSSSSIAKQLRTAQVVKLKGVPIKQPVIFDPKAAISSVDLNRAEYQQFTKVKLRIDQHISHLDGLNARKYNAMGLPLPNREPNVNARSRRTDVSGGIEYKYGSANSLPMVELLESIQSQDAAREMRKSFYIKVGDIRQSRG